MIVPTELTRIDNWVNWIYMTREGKRTKVPTDPKNLRPAACNKPETWGRYATADRNWCKHKADGIGFNLSESPYAAIDLDDCIAEDGTIQQHARDIIDRLNSFTEISPSGRGIRILVKAELPAGRRRKPGVELYDAMRFVSITGNHLPGASVVVAERQAEIEALHSELFPGIEPTPVRPLPPSMANLSDEDVLRRALRAKNGSKFEHVFSGIVAPYYAKENGDPDYSRADFALVRMLRIYTTDRAQIKRLLLRSGMRRPKLQREQYIDMTIERALSV